MKYIPRFVILGWPLVIFAIVILSHRDFTASTPARISILDRFWWLLPAVVSGIHRRSGDVFLLVAKITAFITFGLMIVHPYDVTMALDYRLHLCMTIICLFICDLGIDLS